jgi:quinoprotein glucose dehydrogenase
MRVCTVLCSAAVMLPALHGQNDWPAYGHDSANQKYTSLNQINTGNVSKLVQAWVYDTRPDPTARAARSPSQATPLVVNGVMYIVTAYQSLAAIDPETGKKLWEFSHKHAGRPPRGIAYWPSSGAPLLHVLPHVPRDRDRCLSGERRNDRERAGDCGARIAADDKSL